MWADIDTKKDFLNYAEAAAVVSDVIEDSRMLPTSIGVFGTWGTGKSTLLNILEQELKSRPATQTAIIVRFDAWLYQGYDDAKAALMDVIASKLISETDEEKINSLETRGRSGEACQITPFSGRWCRDRCCRPRCATFRRHPRRSHCYRASCWWITYRERS